MEKVRIKFDFPNSLEKFLKKVQFFLSQGERVPQDKYKLKNKYKNINIKIKINYLMRGAKGGLLAQFTRNNNPLSQITMIKFSFSRITENYTFYEKTPPA